MNRIAALSSGFPVERRSSCLGSRVRTRRAAHGLALLGLMLLAADGARAGWGSPEAVNGNREFAYYPQVAVSGERVHVVWKDCCREVYYVKSDDCGDTWSRPKTLTRIQSGHGFSVAAADDVVHFVFTDDFGDVRYRASHDGGESWEPVSTLASYPFPERTDVLSLDAAGPYAIAAWQVEKWEVAGDERTLTTWIEAVTSADAGRSWNRQRLSKKHTISERRAPGQGRVGLPVAAATAHKPRFHVAWELFKEWDGRRKGGVAYRSGVPGEGWEKTVRLTRPRGKPYFSLEPLALKARRDSVHVLLLGRTSAGLDFSYLHMASQDGGKSFSPRKRLEASPFYGYGSEANRLMAFDKRVVYVLGGGSVVSSSRDSGATWSQKALSPHSNSAIAAARNGTRRCRRSVHLMQYDWPTTVFHRRLIRSD